MNNIVFQFVHSFIKRLFMKIRFIAFLFFSAILACAGSGDKNNSTSKKADKKVAALDGKKIYKANCVTCHGMDGKLGINGSKDLTLCELDLEERIALITNGKGVMTAFSNLLSEEKIKAVAEYTLTLKK